MIAFSAVLLLLFGLILAVGGAYLVWLGGSGYYLIAGLAFALSAVYLLQKRSRGLTLFAITLAATYVWALWESGYDWWPLAARVGLPSLFGLWFVLPFFRRAWQRQSPDGTRGLPALTALVAVAAVAVFGSIANPTHEYPGAVADTVVNPTPNTGPAVPEGEWHAYGRNKFAQRFSPLQQITPANVAQ